MKKRHNVMKMESFSSKKFVVTGLLVMFLILFLGYFTPTQSEKANIIFQTLLVSTAFFLVVPLLYCKIVLQEPLENLGWGKGKVFAGIFTGILSVMVALSSIVALSYTTPLRTHFLFAASVQSDFLWFVLYEALLVPFTALMYEVRFRGLIQRLWLGSLGIMAVLVQSGLFGALLYLSDDLSGWRVSALLFAPLSGLIVYFSGSLWYAWAASWLFFFLSDVFLLVSR